MLWGSMSRRCSMIRSKMSWFKLASDGFVASRGLMGLGWMVRGASMSSKQGVEERFQVWIGSHGEFKL